MWGLAFHVRLESTLSTIFQVSREFKQGKEKTASFPSSNLSQTSLKLIFFIMLAIAISRVLQVKK